MSIVLFKRVAANVFESKPHLFDKVNGKYIESDELLGGTITIDMRAGTKLLVDGRLVEKKIVERFGNKAFEVVVGEGIWNPMPLRDNSNWMGYPNGFVKLSPFGIDPFAEDAEPAAPAPAAEAAEDPSDGIPF